MEYWSLSREWEGKLSLFASDLFDRSSDTIAGAEGVGIIEEAISISVNSAPIPDKLEPIFYCFVCIALRTPSLILGIK